MTNQIPVTALLNNHGPATAVMSGENDYVNNFGGTSSATPLAAGVAALVLSANPNLTWIEARQILRDTAIRIDRPTPTRRPMARRQRQPVGDERAPAGLQPVVRLRPRRTRAGGRRGPGRPPPRDAVVRENLADTGAVPSAGAFWTAPTSG